MPISAPFVGGSGSVVRARGTELLRKIETVTIDPTNALSIETVRGVRSVCIIGIVESQTYGIVIAPTSLCAPEAQINEYRAGFCWRLHTTDLSSFETILRMVSIVRVAIFYALVPLLAARAPLA